MPPIEVPDELFKIPLIWGWECDVPPKVLLLSGYKRTGKDELANYLADESAEHHEWLVYAHPMRQPTASKLYQFNGAWSVAFHTVLWDLVREMLHLPDDYDYEANKDVPRPDDGGRTIRDYMIAVGAKGRKLDPGYWVKQTFGPRYNRAGWPPDLIVCPDHRFVAEYEAAVKEYIRPITARLFRAAVPVPPADIESEHDLDEFTTDFLLLPSADEFARAVEIWPQYKGFSCVGLIE